MINFYLSLRQSQVYQLCLYNFVQSVFVSLSRTYLKLGILIDV